MFKRAVVPLVLAFLLAGAANAVAARTAAQAIRVPDPLLGRVFPFPAMVVGDPALARALSEDPVLRGIMDRREAALDAALSSCGSSAPCLAEAVKFAPATIEQISERLETLAHAGGPLWVLARDGLARSSAFAPPGDEGGAALVRQAWVTTAKGLNRVLDVYGAGAAPRYPEVDSMLFPKDSEILGGLLRAAIGVEREGGSLKGTFLSPAVELGVDLLRFNQRDEAARYEPLEAGENQAALRRLRRTRWTAWRYAAIIVPGAGLTEPEVGLSGAGGLRIELAARRYLAKAAPVIMVSGGHVHPNRTPFNEALEMKRALMARFKIPASAILVDPYARHTTTNLRNAARLLIGAGAPIDKPSLVVTTSDQSAYIQSPIFLARCRSELGYAPFKDLVRRSPYDLDVRLERRSLEVDPQDPLDP